MNNLHLQSNASTVATKTGKNLQVKTIRVGGHDFRNSATWQKLFRSYHAVYTGHDGCEILNMMEQVRFSVSEMELTLAVIPLSELGFLEDTSTKQAFDEIFLKEWSQANLTGYEMRLCPAEVGPSLFLWIVVNTYNNEGSAWGEGLDFRIAMDPVFNYRSGPSIFRISHKIYGFGAPNVTRLVADYAGGPHSLPTRCNFVFILQKS